MRIFFIYVLIAITLISCNFQNKNKFDDGKNNSVVVVEISNAENKKLILSVEGEDFENRQTKTVENGKAIFEINIVNSDIGMIESYDNVENVNWTKHWIPVLLKNDTIVVKTEMVKDSIEIDDFVYVPFDVFDNNIYKKSKKNKVYEENKYKLYKLSEDITYSASTLDSLNQKILPEIRSKTFSLFSNEFSDLSDRIQLELLNKTLNFSAFEPKFLDDGDREKLNKIYSSLFDLDKSANYRLKTVEYSLANINNYGKKNQLIFKDFSLIDINSKNIDLSTITKQNKLTVFYFWFSSCGPCRLFNQNIDSEVINKLSENNIEFVAINTDRNKEDWMKSSKKDNIFWKNLYGGNFKDDIEFEYEIRGYPTKIVFNNNNELIAFSFYKPEDLLNLIELKQETQIK